jgi:hypothetical protein
MNQKALLILIVAPILCAVLGCFSKRDTVVTTEMSKTGKDWGEVQSTQQYRTPGGKIVKEQQTIREEIKCVNKKGKRFPADTMDECLEKGGTIVDEITTTETSAVK